MIVCSGWMEIFSWVKHIHIWQPIIFGVPAVESLKQSWLQSSPSTWLRWISWDICIVAIFTCLSTHASCPVPCVNVMPIAQPYLCSTRLSVILSLLCNVALCALYVLCSASLSPLYVPTSPCVGCQESIYIERWGDKLSWGPVTMLYLLRLHFSLLNSEETKYREVQWHFLVCLSCP